MPGALVADDLSLGFAFTSVAAAMICNLFTEKVVMGVTAVDLLGKYPCRLSEYGTK
jgi:hypothetical protein